MSCCLLYGIIGFILLLASSYAQPQEDQANGFYDMSPNWTLHNLSSDDIGPWSNYGGENRPWIKSSIPYARPSFFRVEPLADCDTAIEAIPDGTLKLDPADPGSMAHGSPKFIAKVPSSARARRFVLPAAIRHRSCLILIHAKRDSGRPLTISEGDWFTHLYTSVFPIARKLAEGMRRHADPLFPPSRLWSFFNTTEGFEHGSGRGFTYEIQLMGILKGYRDRATGQYPTISGAGHPGNHEAERMPFPEEGWRIILSAPQGDLHPLDQWRAENPKPRFNLYEAEGTYHGIGTRGLWWVLDAYYAPYS